MLEVVFGGGPGWRLLRVSVVVVCGGGRITLEQEVKLVLGWVLLVLHLRGVLEGRDGRGRRVSGRGGRGEAEVVEVLLDRNVSTGRDIASKDVTYVVRSC